MLIFCIRLPKLYSPYPDYFPLLPKSLSYLNISWLFCMNRFSRIVFFFQSFIHLFYFYASGGGWGMSHLCLFKNYEFSLGVVPPISIYPSLLSAGIFHLSYTPHSYQPGYFIFHIPLTPISWDISSFIYPSLLSAGIFHLYHIPLTPISILLNYLMNLGAISY